MPVLDAAFWDRITPAARILNTILLAFLINLVAAEVHANTSWADIPAHLGWWTLLVPIAILLLVLDYRSTERLEARVAANQVQTATYFNELRIQIVRRLLDLLASSTLYPKAEGPLNIHIFMAVRDSSGREALKKDRTFAHEREHMPSNYPLDIVYPDEDKLLICDAFNQNTVVYGDVTADMIHNYGSRIKNHVDPKIRWVLACPLHSEQNQRPLGVLCAFGARPFFTSQRAIRYFEYLMIQASEVIVLMLRFQEQLRSPETR